MSYPTTTSTMTTVECEKQVRSWRLLRYLLQLLIPTCIQTQQPSSLNIITGTIFGYRHRHPHPHPNGKLKFCIQSKSRSSPVLLLELSVPTSLLAKEMQGGHLRLAFESKLHSHQSLLSTPIWTLHCNGRRFGYAIKRRISNPDLEVLRMMDSVVVGAGIVGHHDDEVMYLRAHFKRVCGSSDSESYHLIDPDGQELSLFFYRSSH